MKKKKIDQAWVLTGGKGFFKPPLRPRSHDFVLCVNGGYRRAKKLRWKPNLILGDLDSLPRGASVPRCEIMRYPVKKDRSDTELALDYLKELLPKKVFLISSIDKDRPDHFTAHLILLSHYSAYFNCTLLLEKGMIQFVRKSCRLAVPRDATVSLLAFSPARLRTQGLEFSLNNQPLQFPTHGLSNQAIAKEVEVTVTKGAGVFLFIS